MSNNISVANIWLIGSGQMASNYANVLKSLSCDFTVVGRNEKSAKEFEKKTGISVRQGGLENLLINQKHVPTHAIIAVNFENLAHISSLLIEHGVKNILVEKPAGLNYNEIINIRDMAQKRCTNVFVAYNRRFYASVDKAKKIIDDDGGVVSFNFEFTEWSHFIETLKKPAVELENWFLGNSTHVIDLAFYLGGYPLQMNCYNSGATTWYKRASVFSGAGVTDNGALFSYQANWKGPGRWGVEVITPKHRLIFKPLEKLQIQYIGSTDIEYMDIEDINDIEYKPGLYLQTKNFIEDSIDSRFLSIQEHCKNLKVYEKIEMG